MSYRDVRTPIRRRSLAALAASAFVAPVLGTSTARAGRSPRRGTSAAGCDVEVLPRPDGLPGSNLVGGDATGRYFVGNPFIDREYVPLLWADGKVSKLQPEGVGHQVLDVNSSGVAVGGGSDNDIDSYAWAYVDGSFVRLATTGGFNVTASAINENGDIVGGASYGEEDFEPLWWSLDDPDTVHVLKAPTNAWARGISDDGVIMGHLAPEQGDKIAYIWTDVDAEGERLVGPSGSTDTYSADICGQWVVGSDYGDPSGATGAIWNLQDGSVTSNPKQLAVVNSVGDVATVSRLWGESRRPEDSVIIRADGTVVELPSIPNGAISAVTVLCEPDADVSAAGPIMKVDRSSRPVVWRGC